MFEFKQFAIQQDRCAMKIGTDGVLLGAWAPIDHNPFNILDLGTGTGIIALMLAQRSFAQQIDAIEIDPEAYEQATDNFENSNWNDRLFCYHADLNEFAQEIEDKYDLIVSNPPFYSENFKTPNTQRNLARFQDAMPFIDLIPAVASLLSDNGIFAVIIPYKEEDSFIALAQQYQLYPLKITRIKGNPTAEIKRSLLSFGRCKEKALCTNILTIEITRHQYTPQYTALVQDFFVKM